MSTLAVQTEKGTSAAVNTLVMHLKRDMQCSLDDAVLQKELPPFVTLLAPPRVLAPKISEDLTRAVKRQTHVVMIPYSALVSRQLQSQQVIRSFGDDRDGGVWLSGLPADDVTEEDVRALLLQEAAAGCGGEGLEISLPSCGGFAEIKGLPEGAASHVLSRLDGRWWRGSQLLALRLVEAKAKLQVHQSIKAVLRKLAGVTDFHNFIAAKGSASSGKTARRIQHCSSSVQTDLRAARGDRPQGEWLAKDWVEVRFSAKEFGGQQLRRMAGVLVAVVRGVEGDDYLERCMSSREKVATPVAPAEATFLQSYAVSTPQVAEAYLGGMVAAVAGEAEEEKEGEREKEGEEETLGAAASPSVEEAAAAVSFLGRLRGAVMAAAARPYEELVANLEAGDATRASDDAKLRAAAAAGDTEALREMIAVGVARCDAQDEYGRSPLFLSACEGHLDAVRLLLSHDARVAQAAHGCWMPLAAARERGHAAITSLLEGAAEGSINASKLPVLRKALAVHPPNHAPSTQPPTPPAPTPRLTTLVPSSAVDHPGAGTLIIDDVLPPHQVDALCQLWRSLPTAPKEKASPIDRSYYADVDGWICKAIDGALERLGLLKPIHRGPRMDGFHTQPLLRFLHYPRAGGSLPAHVDLPRATKAGEKTTHTLILYLTDCERGGETLLLEARPGDEKVAHAGGVAHGERAILASSAPRRGRLLLMPHACPHSAAHTVSAPKTLLRGEVVM